MSAPGRVAFVVVLLASTFTVGYALIAIAPSQDSRNIAPINLDDIWPTQRSTPTTTIDESGVSIVPPVVLDPFTIPHDPTTSPPSSAKQPDDDSRDDDGGNHDGPPTETLPSPSTTTPSSPPQPDDGENDDGGNDDGGKDGD